MEQIDENALWCKQCKHYVTDGPCLLHSKLVADEVVLSRAYATLPKDLEIIQKPRMKVPGVFATAQFDDATIFGPLEGKLNAVPEPDGSFVYGLAVSADALLYYKLDSDDECNWMKYVRLADSAKSANLLVFQKDLRLYFTNLKPIRKNEELRVWYFAQYARAMGKMGGWNTGEANMGFFCKATATPKGRNKNTVFTFPCGDCQAAFRTADLLDLHGIRHGKIIENPPTNCPDCPFTHPTLQGLLDHVDRHKRKVQHPKTDSQCTICPRRPCFSTPTALANHIQRVHQEADRKHECLICKKKFINLSGLTAHQRSHSTETYYQCPVCQLNLPSSAEMPEHSETHRVDGQFPCQFCGKKYPEFHILRCHLLNDHGNRTWTCEICQKVFKRISGWRRHQASHSSIYPFECETCGRRFKWKRKFEIHKQKLHNPNRVTEFQERSEKVARSFADALLCEFCTRQYSNPERLLIHQRKQHSDRLPAKLRSAR